MKPSEIKEGEVYLMHYGGRTERVRVITRVRLPRIAGVRQEARYRVELCESKQMLRTPIAARRLQPAPKREPLVW